MNCDVAYRFCMLLFSLRNQILRAVILIKCYIHRYPIPDEYLVRACTVIISRLIGLVDI